MLFLAPYEYYAPSIDVGASIALFFTTWLILYSLLRLGDNWILLTIMRTRFLLSLITLERVKNIWWWHPCSLHPRSILGNKTWWGMGPRLRCQWWSRLGTWLNGSPIYCISLSLASSLMLHQGVLLMKYSYTYLFCLGDWSLSLDCNPFFSVAFGGMVPILRIISNQIILIKIDKKIVLSAGLTHESSSWLVDWTHNSWDRLVNW